MFVKLEGKRYGISQVLSPLVNQSDLEMAWRVLRKIAEIEV
ncbi:hypothetical protein [Pseudanabaena sp. Chao 1811]|nr:hypothetical protein [Pseudanabaena sp. Chao 1811]